MTDQDCSSLSCGNDFYNFINKDWIQTTQIPEDQQRWGIFQILQQDTQLKIKNLIESSYAQSHSKFNKISILYNQLIDKNMRNSPNNMYLIQKLVDQIKMSQTIGELWDKIINFDIQFGISIPISLVIQSSLNNANDVILHVSSGGLGLPDRDYYFDESKENIRIEYKKYINKYSKLFNLQTNPDTIFDLEKKIAEKTYTKVQKRNPEIQNNMTTYQDLIKSHPNLSFIYRIFDTANKNPHVINVTNPKYVTNVSGLISNISLDTWKEYFIFKLINEFSDYLSEEIEKCHFDFYSGVLLGTKTLKPLWKRSLEILDDHLGELVGMLFVEKYFDSESKTLAIEIVNYIINELKLYLETNDWMEVQTKKKALEKLRKMNIKIGYPDKIEKEYDKLKINKDNNLLENIIMISSFNNMYKIKRLYEPLDRTLWFMSAHQVNAYYSPSLNDIVFPAGILQEPFFSKSQDIASNFGGFGMVIGHEITHGFDDQGSKFDSDGNLKNWWTDLDRTKYNEKTEIVKTQYSKYVIENNNVNGELTLGENIADIGGLALSFRALKQYLKDKFNYVDTKLLKQFFINYANIWKSKSRKEDTLYRLTVDPHSPPIFRVNGAVKNIDEFYDLFNINKTDALYIEPNKRAKIWQ
jgi:endothelin-converting enzyme/putative endopeptidase